MPGYEFRFMTLIFRLVDLFMPYLERRIPKFGIRSGQTVVDYGCGPGRYTVRLARLVGPSGKVYAVDIHELAIAAVRSQVERLGLTNVEPALAHGYDSGLPAGIADVVCAIDMFFSVPDPTAFLAELKRIARPDAVLIIDDGHQSRREARQKIADSGHWRMVEASRDHLKCAPIWTSRAA